MAGGRTNGSRICVTASSFVFAEPVGQWRNGGGILGWAAVSFALVGSATTAPSAMTFRTSDGNAQQVRSDDG
jgi:hypothetical protein